MENDSVIRAAIQTAVSQGIRDIRRDPRRSIRRLADLGLQFSRGEHQRRFFLAAQSTLRNRNTAYYELIRGMAEHVDPQTLQTLGVNIGYMSWAHGAKLIRAFKASDGVSVPWALPIDMTPANAKPDVLQALIEQGQQLGIYTYFLRIGEHTSKRVLQIANDAADCAFVLFAADAAANRRLTDCGLALHNAVFALNGEPSALAASADALRQKGRLYGLAVHYNDADVEALTSEDFLASVVAAQFPMLFLLCADDCSEQAQEIVHRFAAELRQGNRETVYPVDVLRDLQTIDEFVSETHCQLVLCGNGSVTKPRGANAVFDGSLTALLSSLSASRRS